MSIIDRDALHEGPTPYLGWYLEGTPGKPMGPASYIWYASEDRGDGRFDVCVTAPIAFEDRLAQYEAARQIGLAAIRGKVFLGRWEHGVTYTLNLPLKSDDVPTAAIREAILRALHRLYEKGFQEGDFQVDLDGVAIEMGTTRQLVERAVKFLRDQGLVKDNGPHGRNWSTGDFWLSTAGVTQVEENQSRGQQPASGTAVILFADIADSTALTERLGDAAFREKARELDTALRRAITSSGGTAVEGKLLGDGVLAVFGAAREAIAAALACNAEGNHAGLPLHLGIHAGDVIREEGNVYGGAVNIAARIADASAPGETLVSGTVRELARTSAGVSFEDRGERTLKGVGEPVRVWAIKRET